MAATRTITALVLCWLAIFTNASDKQPPDDTNLRRKFILSSPPKHQFIASSSKPDHHHTVTPVIYDEVDGQNSLDADGPMLQPPPEIGSDDGKTPIDPNRGATGELQNLHEFSVQNFTSHQLTHSVWVNKLTSRPGPPSLDLDQEKIFRASSFWLAVTNTADSESTVQCPWKSHSRLKNRVRCLDGSTCEVFGKHGRTNWDCCQKRQSRIDKCPSAYPVMCGVRMCTHDSEYCCVARTSRCPSDEFGSPMLRPCPDLEICPWALPNPEPDLLSCSDGTFCNISAEFELYTPPPISQSLAMKQIHTAPPNVTGMPNATSMVVTTQAPAATLAFAPGPIIKKGWDCCQRVSRLSCPSIKPLMCAKRNACSIPEQGKRGVSRCCTSPSGSSCAKRGCPAAFNLTRGFQGDSHSHVALHIRSQDADIAVLPTNAEDTTLDENLPLMLNVLLYRGLQLDFEKAARAAGYDPKVPGGTTMKETMAESHMTVRGRLRPGDVHLLVADIPTTSDWQGYTVELTTGRANDTARNSSSPVVRRDSRIVLQKGFETEPVWHQIPVNMHEEWHVKREPFILFWVSLPAIDPNDNSTINATMADFEEDYVFSLCYPCSSVRMDDDLHLMLLIYILAPLLGTIAVVYPLWLLYVRKYRAMRNEPAADVADSARPMRPVRFDASLCRTHVDPETKPAFISRAQLCDFLSSYQIQQHTEQFATHGFVMAPSSLLLPRLDQILQESSRCESFLRELGVDPRDHGTCRFMFQTLRDRLQDELSLDRDGKPTPSSSHLHSEVDGLAGGSVQGREKQPVCAICLQEYLHGDEIQGLECGHEFHLSCVRKWVQQNPTCPNCRHDLHSSSHAQLAGIQVSDGND